MVSLIISEMYRDVANRGIHNYSVRKTFPRECFTEVCIALQELSEFNTNPHIDCDVHLHRRIFSVKISYTDNVGTESGVERKVKHKFEELGII